MLKNNSSLNLITPHNLNNLETENLISVVNITNYLVLDYILTVFNR